MHKNQSADKLQHCLWYGFSVEAAAHQQLRGSLDKLIRNYSTLLFCSVLSTMLPQMPADLLKFGAFCDVTRSKDRFGRFFNFFFFLL